MKIKINGHCGEFCIYDKSLDTKEWNYVYSELNLENCGLNCSDLFFEKDKINQKFCKQFNLDIKPRYRISIIKNENPEAYQWLKDNFCKDLYKFSLHYNDKNKLKLCVNRLIVINIKRKFKK